MWTFKAIIFLIIPVFLSNRNYALDQEWNGNWFPHPPTKEVDNNPLVKYKLHESSHAPQMGAISKNCDDGKTNLTIDWDNSPINYTCFESKSWYSPNANVKPLQITYNIPKEYSALHTCMDTPIFYDDRIPTFGTHRPLWAKYGEYTFLPRQRWLHNLEHGALVMLYHPCANHEEVKLLKKIVKRCLHRHIITPYALLNMKRPLALVAWGESFEMSKLDVQLAVNFIKEKAIRGPEMKSDDGQYDYELTGPAKIISDEDNNLCPDM